MIEIELEKGLFSHNACSEYSLYAMNPGLSQVPVIQPFGAFVLPSPPQLTSATQHSWHLIED